MGNEALIARFAAAVSRAFSMKLPDKVEKQIDLDRWHSGFAKEEYDTAIRIVNGVKDAKTLATMCNKYLVAFHSNPGNRFVTHFYRSDQLFFELFQRCKKISTKKENLFADWAGLLDNPNPTLMKMRFVELSPTYQSMIRALVPKPEKPVLRLLDYLREVYKQKYGDPPSSNAKLYDLDPAPGSALAGTVQAHITNINLHFKSAMNGNKPVPRQLFKDSLTSYRRFLKKFDKTQVLPLFQVIKILQVRIRGNDGGPIGVEERRPADLGFASVEMYSMACMQLMLLAQGKLVIRENREGFTTEEADYLLGPIGGGYRYQSNIDHRFRSPMGDAEAKFSLSDMFLDLMLITHNQLSRAKLVDLKTSHELQNLWVPYRHFVKALARSAISEVAEMAKQPGFPQLLEEATRRLQLEVPVGVSGPDLGKATARVGSSPGSHAMFGKITIIDMKVVKSPTFYVEFEKLAPHLFEVNLAYIEDKVYGTRMQEVIQGFDAYWMLLKALWEALQYAPALVTGGFSALVTAYIKDKITEAAMDLVVDLATEIHPSFGKVLEIASQIPVVDIGKWGVGKFRGRGSTATSPLPDAPTVPHPLADAPALPRSDRPSYSERHAPPSKSEPGHLYTERMGGGMVETIRGTKAPIVAKATDYKMQPVLRNPKADAPRRESVSAGFPTTGSTARGGTAGAGGPAQRPAPAIETDASRMGSSRSSEPRRPMHTQQGQQTVGVRRQNPIPPDDLHPRSPPPSGQKPMGQQQQQAKRQPTRKTERPESGAPASRELRPGERATDKAADLAGTQLDKQLRREKIEAQHRLQQVRAAGSGQSILKEVEIETPYGPATLYVVGDPAAFRDSQLAGTQVYSYANKRGGETYAGIAGQSQGSEPYAPPRKPGTPEPEREKWLPPGTDEKPFSHWWERVVDSHRKGDWIDGVSRVEIRPAPYAQTQVGEQVRIDANQGRSGHWNIADNSQAERLRAEGIANHDALKGSNVYRFEIIVVIH